MNAGEAAALALVLPVVGAALVAVCGRAPNLRETVSLATAVATFALVASLVPGVVAGGRPAYRAFDLFREIPLAFEVEPLGMLFALVASGLWIVSTVYSIGYMRGNREGHQTRFYVCFGLAIACALAIAFSANLLTLFLFYEALTLVTYPLVTHHGDAAARRGGRVYLGVLLFTSTALLFPAIVATWFFAGTLDFAPGGVLAGKLSQAAATILLMLYVFGIGKAALMPFHRWLPAAMVAPTPVSALLHAVAVVKAGVFSVIKIVVYTFGIGAAGADFHWLVVASGFTIVAASVVALRSDNLKRRLAYSTVSQLSYVVLATALLASVSIVGAALHLVAHAVSKITLFFAAGAIYTAAHKTNVSELDGMGRRMPWTFATFAVASISLIGLPPTAGLVSKWYIVAGAVEVESWLALAVMAASTLLSAGYLLPIVFRGFMRSPAPADAALPEAPRTMVAAMVVTATLTTLMFFFADAPLALARGLVER